MVTFGFESFTAIWEHRKYAGNPQENHRIGAYFYGTEGIFHMGWRDGWTFYPRKASESTVHQEPSFDHVEDGHNLTLLWQDFIDAIDQARPPVADIAPAHRSSLLPMLGMISHRLGRSLNWDGQTESILGDSEAKSLMRRAYRQPWTYPSLQSKTSSNQPSP
jgi:predicted dehydrogenase